ncbi:hypothetical protein CDAR_519621 [Caerostris darwini]|uniref:Uncharacterized protein n=1 Tax=Caerostris darwini TaxID=1538125 RepID=A0AAV4RB58_9ARAC|nr:hypothetical protein CDAR_519621 [Caerostris darwini]
MTALQAPFANSADSIPGSPGQSSKWFSHRTPSWIIRFPLPLILRDTYAQTPRLHLKIQQIPLVGLRGNLPNEMVQPSDTLLDYPIPCHLSSEIPTPRYR